MAARSYGVVICSHNRLPYLQRTVEYFIKSPDVEERDIQLILADDKSSDGTVEWAKDSGLFSVIFRNPKPGSYSLNTIRNGGIARCVKEYIILLDCDCRPVDGFLHGHDAVFDKYPKAISIGLTDRYDEEGEKLIAYDLRRPMMRGEAIMGIGWANAYGGNIAFPLSLWQATGGFDEAFDGGWGFEDLDFSFRAHRIGYACVCHQKTLVRHMWHKVSKEAKAGHDRNNALFEKKHKIRF